MTPRHELCRLLARERIEISDRRDAFHRTLPREWRDAAPGRRGPPDWLWWAVCLFAVWVLWTWGFRQRYETLQELGRVMSAIDVVIAEHDETGAAAKVQHG